MPATGFTTYSLMVSEASSAAQMLAISKLAREIWTHHYVPIIGQRQVEYMLENFQSATAIAEQVENGFHYYQVLHKGRLAAYFALMNRSGKGEIKISKFYVHHDLQRRGIGRQMMMYIEKQGAEQGIRDFWLTVNRHNYGAFRFYRQLGFKPDGSLIQDIGQGFVMDDYKMTKHIGPKIAQQVF